MIRAKDFTCYAKILFMGAKMEVCKEIYESFLLKVNHTYKQITVQYVNFSSEYQGGLKIS